VIIVSSAIQLAVRLRSLTRIVDYLAQAAKSSSVDYSSWVLGSTAH